MNKKIQVHIIDRRKFLVKFGKSAAVFTIMGAQIKPGLSNHIIGKLKAEEDKSWSSGHPLPNASDPVKPVPGTRKELTPVEDHYKMFNAKIPDKPDLGKWRLKIGGLAKHSLEWTMSDIRRFTSRSEFVTLTCISNPVGGPLTSTTRWTGVSLQKLLPHWNLKAQATHLKILAADGFYETVDLKTVMDDERVMLVYAWDGLPLPLEHGYPLRIYIPNRFGMKQPKWIESIIATDHWEAGFSVKNTWDKDAIMETTSVIDTIHQSGESDKNQIIQIGGIAHAGSRGISKVVVQVNSNGWQKAMLRKPLSDLSWVLWRFEWPFTEGEHEFSVMAYEKSGIAQKTKDSGPYPDGATGILKRKYKFSRQEE